MATDLKQQSRPTPAAMHEQFVEQQLERARRRIRNLDAVTSLLLLLLGAVAYGVVTAVLDRTLTLPTAVRMTAFVACAAAGVLYLGLILFRFVQWQVNPYYAARRLEETLPDAKNSLINWLDLRDAPMAPVIRGTLGRKAAKDLTRADFENAVSAKHALWLTGVLAGLALALFVWFLMGPAQFASLLQRAFDPFKEIFIATSTQLHVVAPVGGNAIVPVRQDVQIRVEVSRRVPRVNAPDALRLHYRYRQADPYIVRPLDEDADGQWVKTLVADEVRTGFWYKVTGGDAETPEYQVQVRALPQVTRFDVKYHYRPYLRQPDQEVRYGPSEAQTRPDLKGLRGTEVTLVARTNRPWQSGHLVLKEGPAVKQLPGEAVADDPQARRFKITLERRGSFEVHFTSPEGEKNIDRGEYWVEVLDDRTPTVTLTKPGKDIKLPANGALALEGSAVDDFGIKGITLKLRQATEPRPLDLAPKPYREGVSFKLADGTYPEALEYKDFVALEKLKTIKGEPFAVKPGMVLEYWLEAVDNADYPEAGGNVGKSKVYKVTIAAPETDQKKQEQERQKAEQEQKRHEQKQDKAQGERDKDAAERKADEGKSPEEKARADEKRREQFDEQVRQLERELKRRQEEQERKGGAKGDSNSEPKGGAKEKGPEQGGAGDKKDEKNKPADGEAAQKKDGAEKGKGGERGAAKDAGDPKKQNGQQAQGDGKDKGNPDPQAGPQGQAKNDKGAKKDSAPSQAKGAGLQQPNGQPQEQAGAGKDEGQKKDQKADAGKSKQGAGEKAAQGGAKNGGQDGQKTETAGAKGDGQGQAAGQQAKTDPKGAPKSEVAHGKDAGKGAEKMAPSQAKGQGQPAQGDQRQAQGGVKGDQPQQPHGAGKQGENQAQGGTAKGNGPQGQGGAGKQATPQQAREAGAGKGERDPGARQTADNRREQQRPEDATMEDIARLKERLERQGQKEDAVDDLSRVRKEARDPKVRQAAEKALADAGVKPRVETGAAKGPNGSPEKVAKGAPKNEGQGPPGSKTPPGDARQGAGEPGQQVGKGKDGGEGAPGKAVSKGAPKGTGNGTPGGDRTAQARGGFQDEPGGIEADAAAAKRAGDLQLEELKKKLTPEMRKTLKWEQEDVDRFLRDARAYHERLQQQEKVAGPDKLDAPGSRRNKSWLPSVGTQQVGPRTAPTRDPLEIGRSLPPPEFREAQKLFTGRPRD